MEGLSPGIEHILEICALLEEHRAGDVKALDMRHLHLWTDFFIIATVSSGAHQAGLLRHLKDYAAGHDFAFRTGRRIDDSWNPVDLGGAVVHLMNAVSREFYELEELWNNAGIVFPGAYRRINPQAQTYSSKPSSYSTSSS
ncbi:MAG: ribosome silencing factor [Treponema sp.]|jgi:ribosome-associated protein|nr:ribosome silencing factor [Treponema sp.]